jgi:hypothetical protein
MVGIGYALIYNTSEKKDLNNYVFWGNSIPFLTNGRARNFDGRVNPSISGYKSGFPPNMEVSSKKKCGEHSFGYMPALSLINYDYNALTSGNGKASNDEIREFDHVMSGRLGLFMRGLSRGTSSSSDVNGTRTWRTFLLGLEAEPKAEAQAEAQAEAAVAAPASINPEKGRKRKAKKQVQKQKNKLLDEDIGDKSYFNFLANLQKIISESNVSVEDLIVVTGSSN